MDLSLIVPLYNEEKCLKENVELIKACLDMLEKDYEIILVNDGSRDGTEAIAKKIVERDTKTRLLTSTKNHGKGYAVKWGVLNAFGKYTIFVDADLAVPIHFIEPLLEQLQKETSLVIGSRHLPDSSFKVCEGLARQLLGEIFRRGTRWALDLRVSDITCGFKGFTRAAALDIFSRSVINRWGYDAEILFLAQELGHQICEIPVDWYHSFDSKVKVGVDSFRTLAELFRIYYYHRIRGYRLPKAVLEEAAVHDRSVCCQERLCD